MWLGNTRKEVRDSALIDVSRETVAVKTNVFTVGSKTIDGKIPFLADGREVESTTSYVYNQQFRRPGL